MKTSFAAAAAFLATYAAAGPPSCAYDCWQDGWSKTGCDWSDGKCLCSNTTALNDVNSCIDKSSCSDDDKNSVYQIIAQSCANAGVSISASPEATFSATSGGSVWPTSWASGGWGGPGGQGAGWGGPGGFGGPGGNWNWGSGSSGWATKTKVYTTSSDGSVVTATTTGAWGPGGGPGGWAGGPFGGGKPFGPWGSSGAWTSGPWTQWWGSSGCPDSDWPGWTTGPWSSAAPWTTWSGCAAKTTATSVITSTSGSAVVTKTTYGYQVQAASDTSSGLTQTTAQAGAGNKLTGALGAVAAVGVGVVAAL